jgi:hypothetical protein
MDQAHASGGVTRRGFIGTAGAAALTLGLHATPGLAQAATNVGAFRVVRATAGAPSVPEITLPDGYSFVPGAQHRVSSRLEHYAFIRGAYTRDGIDVEVRWPGVPIAAVVWSEERRPLTLLEPDGSAVRFTCPVVTTTPVAHRGTLEIWSYPSTVAGLQLRVEHNHADRAVTWWADRSWVAGETRSVLHQLFASYWIIVDSGLAADAARRGHFWAVQGFETNNTLHLDNPPHWHFSYVPGANWSATPQYIPHFWIDDRGRNFYNGMDVSGQGRSRYYVGDPAVIRLADGTPLVTLTIREDGGLDVEPEGGPRYSMVGDYRGLVDDVWIEKDGRRWMRVTAVDDTEAGRLDVDVVRLRGSTRDERHSWRYDPLTGTLLS